MFFSIINYTMKSNLIISLPRGLYRLTKCNDCGFVSKCQNCDNNLTTIKLNNKQLLICSECQTQYQYPTKCEKCNSLSVKSMFGGRDYLSEKIINEEINADISNRIYDPTLDYSNYKKIIITHAENLFIGIDYQSTEEVSKSITELILNVSDDTTIVFDQKINTEKVETLDNPILWFYNILNEEKKKREKFSFPPSCNLLLISVSEKSLSQAQAKLNTVRNELMYIRDNNLTDLGKPSQPYEAKMLKRKGYYTMHLFIKYPKNYEKITILNNSILELKKRYRLTIRLNPRHIF
jgi:primosomal protein N'